MTAILRLLLIAAIAYGAAACQFFTPPETAQELADALNRHGIGYTEAEPLDFSGMRFAKIDEGLRLTGEDLRMEILRIEDPRTFEMASSAGFLLRLFDDQINESLGAPDMFVSKPFVVIIRQEPEPGETRRALQVILPEEPEN